MHNVLTRPHFNRLCPLLATLCVAVLSIGTTFAQSTPAVSAQQSSQIAQAYGKLPLSFEANQGQSRKKVKFLSRGNGYSLFLTDKSAVIALTRNERNAIGDPKNLEKQPPAASHSDQGHKFRTDVLRMELSGASPDSRVAGADALPGMANYFPTSDQKTWHTNIPTYGKVKYSGVYPGVDLVYYGNQRQLEYDFVVAPEADPAPIQLHFAGAKKLRLTPEGDLDVIAANGEIAFQKPIVYQMQNGVREPIVAAFQLLANNGVRFSLGNYDHARELIIDPVLVYSTYLGGSGTDQVYAIAIDSSGDAYLTGDTTSTSGTAYPVDFPTTSKSYQAAPGPRCCGTQTEAFVTKLNAAGTALVYSTFLGNGDNHGRAIAIDAAGDAYITGYTSGNFPVTPRVYEGTIDGTENAFVTELASSGATLVNSTFLGANPFSQGLGIAVDANGDVFVAGQANSACCNTFPTTTGAYQTANNAPSSVFVSRLSANLSTLAYSTLIGGSGGSGDAARGLAIDASDNAYIVGYASSSNYPTSPKSTPYQKSNGTAKNTTDPAPGYNAVVSKINPTGTALLYSTYLGGSGGYDSAHNITYYDYGNAIRLDAAGNIYVAGSTGSANFPTTTSAYQTKNPEVAKGGYQTGFITKFNPTLSSLIYSTYLGGKDGFADSISALALDGAGNVYVTGNTSSNAFPLTSGAYQTSNPGEDNFAIAPFLTKLNSTGSTLIFSTYFGGENGDSANGIAVDSNSNAYLAGYSNSTDFPISSSAYQKTNNTNTFTGWVAKLSTPATGGTNPTVIALAEDPESQGAGSPVTFTANVASGDDGALPTGTVAFSVDGTEVATLTLSGGEASYTTSTLAVGEHSIVATYSGDKTYAPNTATGNELITTPLAAPPSFSLASGTYTMTESVSLGDSTPGATIYYTLDGSTPTASSTKYSGPIPLTSSTIINAIAAAPGFTDSNVASKTYSIVGSPFALASRATAIDTPNATLDAVVDTMGLSGNYHFRYGTTSTTLNTTTAVTTLNATTAQIKVSAPLTTLKSKTTYYFQVVVTTSGGTASGAVISFTTNYKQPEK